MPDMIDLTLSLTPGARGVSFERTFTKERDGWNGSTWHLYSHSGTHMDAPLHFAAGSGTIDQVPLRSCIAPAWVVELRPCAMQAIHTPADLGPVRDRFRPGEALLLRTGWSDHAATPSVYRDGLPRIGEALAQWCVDHRVSLLGVEPPSVADVNNLPEVTRIHEILLAGGVAIVEGLAHLDRITDERVLFGALPLKLTGSDGSPVRAFALQGVDPDAFTT